MVDFLVDNEGAAVHIEMKLYGPGSHNAQRWKR